MIKLSLRELQTLTRKSKGSLDKNCSVLDTKGKNTKSEDQKNKSPKKGKKKLSTKENTAFGEEIKQLSKQLPRQERKAYSTDELLVEINLEPRPKERARTFIDTPSIMRAFAKASGDARKFAALISARGNGSIMRTITPQSTREFEEAITLIAMRALSSSGLKPFQGPIEMDINIRFQGDPKTWPTSQGDGDIDNIEKAVLDGLKPVWVDDRLVVKKTTIKQCSLVPGITVKIRLAQP